MGNLLQRIRENYQLSHRIKRKKLSPIALQIKKSLYHTNENLEFKKSYRIKFGSRDYH